jgi:hypothetical protein
MSRREDEVCEHGDGRAYRLGRGARSAGSRTGLDNQTAKLIGVISAAQGAASFGEAAPCCF